MNRPLFDFIKSFLMPTLIGKTGVMFFGLNYSQYPGEGYGYGLIASILLTVFTLFRLVQKYKDREDL